METKHRKIITYFLPYTGFPPFQARCLRTLSLSTARCLAKLWGKKGRTKQKMSGGIPWLTSHEAGMERKGFSGLKQKRAEMHSCRAGRELPPHAQKPINARRRWKRVGRWRSTSGKQQCWKASPSRLSLLLSPTIPWRLWVCHRAWRNPVSWQPWPLLRGQWK